MTAAGLQHDHLTFASSLARYTCTNSMCSGCIGGSTGNADYCSYLSGSGTRCLAWCNSYTCASHTTDCGACDGTGGAPNCADTSTFCEGWCVQRPCEHGTRPITRPSLARTSTHYATLKLSVRDPSTHASFGCFRAGAMPGPAAARIASAAVRAAPRLGRRSRADRAQRGRSRLTRRKRSMLCPTCSCCVPLTLHTIHQAMGGSSPRKKLTCEVSDVVASRRGRLRNHYAAT